MSLRRHILPVAAAVLALAAAVSVHAGPVKSNGAGLGSINGNGNGNGNAGGSQPALAAPTYCSDVGSPNVAGMTLGDVTFSGNTPSTSADDCFGIVSGNDANSDINALIGSGWDTGWSLLAKDDKDGSSGSFGGVSFDLTAIGLGQTGGSWTLAAGPASALPLYLDFIAVLKGSNEFALWYFNDVRIGGNDGGDWATVFTNTQDGLQGLSHMSLYVRQGTRPPEIPPPGTVPEPSGLELAALALVAAGAARRRRRP